MDPIPDLFAFLPHEYARVLFHDPERGLALLTGGLDFTNLEALAQFYIANSRRMATAGKMLIPPIYGEKWIELIPDARLVQIDAAGHMLPYEQPKAFASVVTNFLG